MDYKYYHSLYLNTQLPDHLRSLIPDPAKLQARREEAAELLNFSSTERYWYHLQKLPIPSKPVFANYTGDTVFIGREEEIPADQKVLLKQCLTDLCPWRKGPFSYFGIRIDSEWRSYMKWDRVMELIAPNLEDKVIADVGCNNGYYMYRMLPHKPRFVIGFDPMERYYFHHLLSKGYTNAQKLHFELLGSDDLPLYGEFFDTVFFMGILYHRRNPIQALENVAASMKKNGLLILESAGILGDEPVCFFPEERYMKAKGYWFMPTAKAICHMLTRTGFYNVKVHQVVKTTLEEQRQTPWANTESLDHFLDPSDPEKTVEGYPAPYRIYISARKR